VKLLPPPDLSGLPARDEDEESRFRFPPVAGAQGYRAQVATDREFSLIMGEAVGDAPDLQIRQLADGHYWLRVRSRDAGGLEGPDAIREFDRLRLLAAPRPAEPRAGAFVTGTGVLFRWAAVSGADSYRLQLARDAGFAGPLVERERIARAEALVEPLAPGSWVWRVAAVDAAGRQGRWSASQDYRQHLPSGPIDEPVVGAKTVAFAWQGETGQPFEIQVARDRDFTRLVGVQQADGPRAILARPAAGTYYVRVRAQGADGYVGPFAPARRFSVPLPWWTAFAALLLAAPFL
jgi:hypothetical protein